MFIRVLSSHLSHPLYRTCPPTTLHSLPTHPSPPTLGFLLNRRERVCFRHVQVLKLPFTVLKKVIKETQNFIVFCKKKNFSIFSLKSPLPHFARPRPPLPGGVSGHLSLAVLHGVAVVRLGVRGRVRVGGVQAGTGGGHDDSAPPLLFFLQQLLFLRPLDVLDRLAEERKVLTRLPPTSRTPPVCQIQE